MIMLENGLIGLRDSRMKTRRGSGLAPGKAIIDL